MAFQKLNANDDELYSALAAKFDVSNVDVDGTLAANSDGKVPSQKAVKTAINALIAANDVEVFKGSIDCSSNPNYPAADAGHVYRVSVAGRIGGASGVNVEIGDRLQCILDGTAAGDQSTAGAKWWITQANIDGAVVGPTSSTDASIAVFDGATGKLIKDSGVRLSDIATGATDIASAVHGAASKTTPDGTDELGLAESGSALKKLTWANLKAALKSYFDGLYQAIPGAWSAYTPSVSAGSGSFASVSAAGRYAQIGKTVTCYIKVTIAANGSAAGYILVSTPLPIRNYSACIGRETAVVGAYVYCAASPGAGVVVVLPDQSYIGGDGYVIEFTFSYETT
jgi:hypothetical protein